MGMDAFWRLVAARQIRRRGLRLGSPAAEALRTARVHGVGTISFDMRTRL